MKHGLKCKKGKTYYFSGKNFTYNTQKDKKDNEKQSNNKEIEMF